MKTTNDLKVNQDALAHVMISERDRRLAMAFNNLPKQPSDPEVWFSIHKEVIMDFLAPVYDKYRNLGDLISKQENEMIFSDTRKSSDYPLLHSFCRDVFNVFRKMWDFFGDDKVNLYYAYFFRVVENGMYSSQVTGLIECSVIYPILAILANEADGDAKIFWIFENVLTKREWDSLRNDRKNKLNRLSYK